MMQSKTALQVVGAALLILVMLIAMPLHRQISPFSNPYLLFSSAVFKGTSGSADLTEQNSGMEQSWNIAETYSDCPHLSNLIKEQRLKDDRVQIITEFELARKSQLTAGECAKMQFQPSSGPAMNDADRYSFKYYLRQKQQHTPCMTYVEWGSGGSTFWALPHAARVLSIENHPEWCKKMLENQEIQCSILQGKLVYVCVDGGSVGAWGKPTNSSTYQSELYINVLDQFNIHPDFVLVDGRYRVATALSSFKSSKEDSLLLIHDYYNRRNYWELEKFFSKVPSYKRRSDAVLGVFQKKPEVAFDQLDKYINIHFSLFYRK